MNLTPSARTLIRKLADADGQHRYPVDVIQGDDAPALTGRGWYYTTKTGRPVYHPSAYMKAYGKPVYHASTRRVEVGEGWIRKNLWRFHKSEVS
jgi:hypothetical protein